MGRLLAVTSGKGGVGKSSVAVNLAEALSDLGNKVLLIDLDAGMRCLDLLLGVSDSLVFDLNDILENNDAYHGLQAVDGLIITGPTGTNVNDVAVALCHI